MIQISFNECKIRNMLDVSADSDACPLWSVSLHGNYVIAWCSGQIILMITISIISIATENLKREGKQ